jgi:hypothetical protein
MKRFILALAFLIPSVSFGSDLSFQTTTSGAGKITVENTTVALTSHTAVTIGPAGNYMELHLSAPTATYYYRIDGTTTSVQTAGFPVLNTVATVIKVIRGNTVALQSGAGAAAETLRAVKVTAK